MFYIILDLSTNSTSATIILHRFMIACDSCDEWYHGKCVHVTEREGRLMDKKNIKYICPLCKSAHLMSFIFSTNHSNIVLIISLVFFSLIYSPIAHF